MRAILLALLLTGCAAVEDLREDVQGRGITVPAFTVLIIHF